MPQSHASASASVPGGTSRTCPNHGWCPVTYEPEVIERYGDWIAELHRRDVKAFREETLWFWTFGHARAGQFESGFHRDRLQAEAAALAHLDRWKNLR